MLTPHEGSKQEKIILPPWRRTDDHIRMGASVDDIVEGGITAEQEKTVKQVFRGE